MYRNCLIYRTLYGCIILNLQIANREYANDINFITSYRIAWSRVPVSGKGFSISCDKVYFKEEN